MLHIGDRVRIDNFASRVTSNTATGFTVRYQRQLLSEQHQQWGIFVGWGTVYVGEVIESTNGSKGARGNGKLVERKAVKVAMVQPTCGAQWRQPRRMFITDEGMAPQYANTCGPYAF